MESTSNGSAPIFDYLRRYKFKKVVLCNDTDIGLRAVIAIHSTALGPAAGGLRMWTYASEEEAIMDALRLARGMTYKYAAAGVNLDWGQGGDHGQNEQPDQTQREQHQPRDAESEGIRRGIQCHQRENDPA